MIAKKNLPLIALLVTVPVMAGAIFTSISRLEKPNPISRNSETSVELEDSTDVNTFPAVMVKNDSGVSNPIRMSQLVVSVEVVGNVATTTMEMTFHNDSNRVLEGQLYFPLSDGQTVSRFAMDVDGKLREGVVVEKNKGQEVFETVIRRRIDPGLLEWTKGNNFKARVYPLEPDKEKRILIAFEQEMVMQNGRYVYNLPMNFEEEFDQFAFRFKSHNQKSEPNISKNSNLKLRFEREGNGFVTSTERTKFLANKIISIDLPFDKDGKQILTERIPGTNKHYYYISFPEMEVNGEVAKPNSVALIWDASNSAQSRNREREFQFLEHYLKWNPNASIKLFVLRNDLQEIREERFSASNYSRLNEILQKIPLDGASAYEQIDYTNLNADAVMVFGDGLSNFGEQKLVLPEIPIYTVNSSASANHSYLKYLSSSSGGEYINLMEISSSEAIDRLGKQSFKYFGNKMTESFPSIPTSINGYIHIVGIIEGTTNIPFEFGTPDNRRVENVTINPSQYETNSGLLQRIWAQKKLAELDINHKKNSELITALGKKYALVTRNTSLIVLDRVADYVEHEIMPPPELRKEYYAALEDKRENREDRYRNHIEKVKQDFNNYVVWWNTEIDLNQIIEEDKKRQEELDRASEAGAVSTDSIALSGQVLYHLSDGNATRTEEIGNSYNFEVSNGATQGDDMPVDRSSFDFKNKDRLTGKNGKIELAKWEPDAAYMKPLKEATNDKVYATYLELKKTHAKTPAFFLDAADVFLDKKQDDLALRVLSNIAEMELQNHELMRVLAHRLEQLEYFGLAAAMYQEVLNIRKEEPQSYRDLGLCLAKKGEYQEAVSMLYSLAKKPWDGRFPGIETIALIEMNRIIEMHPDKVSTQGIDPALIKAMPSDVRVVLNWDSDNCDMDLWVTDPRGEKCFFSNKNTKIGGRMSNDFTRGYGPEQFLLKKALKGDYKVQVNYYGTSTQRVSGPTTIQIQMITNYGKPNEKVQEVTRRLGESKEVLDIGSFAFQ